MYIYICINMCKLYIFVIHTYVFYVNTLYMCPYHVLASAGSSMSFHIYLQNTLRKPYPQATH